MGSSLSFFTFIYLFFLLFSFQLTSSRQPLCHDNEHSALLKFKESISIDCNSSLDDPSACSAKTEHWNLEGNGDCCSWDGVKCSEDTGYVIKLDLSSSCLYGSINSTNTLFNLIHLQWLSLAYNNFTASMILSGIMNLSRLSHLNLSYSFFSGQIPPEMLELSNLESLDLSGNELQLLQPNLKSLVENLTNLKVLDLSSVNNISSSQLEVLTNLSSLNFLSLQNCNLEGTIPSPLGKLYNLIHLDLSYNNLGVLDLSRVNNISSSQLEVLTNLSSLNFLSLRFCELEGTIPSSLGNLSNLIHLDLSYNFLGGQIPSEMLNLSQLEYLDLSLNDDSSREKRLQLRQPGGLRSLVDKLTNLKRLDLTWVNISSSIPTRLGNLSSLTHLTLQGCQLQGTIPSSIGSLTDLVHLDINNNNFRGKLSVLGNLTQLNTLRLSGNNFSSGNSSSWSWIAKNTKLTVLSLSGVNLGGEIPFWLLNLTHLSFLDMSSNQLTGPIPFWLINLNQLSYLSFRSNQLTGQIPSEISNLTQLNFLYLSSNQLQGPIPSSIFQLNNLESLGLSSNNLSLELEMFLQLKSLRSLSLSSNRLSLLSNFSVNTSSPKFQSLGLGSCNLRSFPYFLRYQDQLDVLDLSSNNISGQIPGWFFNLSIGSLYRLNLSRNLLTGFEQRPVVLPWTSLYYLDLRFNRLQGPLPIPPMSTSDYLVSNNKLSGEIPSWMCKLNYLYALDLSNNNLSGKLPKCLGNFSYGLSMLDLQNNKFYGSIPLNFINGTELKMIDLSNNLLRGKIPRSLVNCTVLEYLDLGNNKINDTFPSWMGSLPKLEVLNLKSNKLHGVIEEPKSGFVFPKLRMIDLSHNRFIGKFPSKYFQCWNAMKFDNQSGLTYMMKGDSIFEDWYDYSLIVFNKGREIEYVKIPNMLTGIWLSSNAFEGDIPATISTLKGLRYLDLSNNNLVGGIPSSLDNLTVLESLDLSNNKLSGEIPQQLVKLTFLAFFNVSDNQLEGPIPQGPQFNTFDNTSYEGNSGLCGQPLSRICGNYELPLNDDDEGSESPFAFGWKVVAIGYACGLIIGVVLGYIFCTRKHEWFVKIFGMPLKRKERKRGRPRN